MNETDEDEIEDLIETKDSNGNTLAHGDSVILIKDLKLKGSSIVIKKGTKVKSIRLTDEPNEIECSVDGMKGIVLKTEFLKKA